MHTTRQIAAYTSQDGTYRSVVPQPGPHNGDQVKPPRVHTPSYITQKIPFSPANIYL